MPLRDRTIKDLTVDWLLALWPILSGATILGFSDRFTSSSWRFAFGMPGGYITWGWLLLGIGAVMAYCLIRRHHPTDASKYSAFYLSGLWVVGGWWWLLAALFAVTAVRDPAANPFGIVVWALIGALNWLWASHLARFR